MGGLPKRDRAMKKKVVEMRSSPSGWVGERGELTVAIFDLSVLEFGMPLGSAVFNIESPVSR